MTAGFVDDVALTWGESLRWDDRRRRLYFVDCAQQTLHWLEDGQPPLRTLQLASLPTGIALTDGDDLVVCMDGGLHLVDPDAGTAELVAPYPDGMYGRANDMAATPDGAVVTGTLNLGPGPGSLWRWSSDDGWDRIDDDNGNVNGPVVVGDDLYVADSVAGVIHAYDAGRSRRTVFDHAAVGGMPDGACADADGGLWSCSLGRGALVRLQTPNGELDRTVEVPFTYPSDIAFGGAELDRAFVVSIALDLGAGEPGTDAGRLLVLDDLGVRGRVEHRVDVRRTG